MAQEHFLNTIQQRVAVLPEEWTVELIEGDIEAYKQRVLTEHQQALAQHGDRRTQADYWREVRRELERTGYYDHAERESVRRHKRIEAYRARWRCGPFNTMESLPERGQTECLIERNPC